MLREFLDRFGFDYEFVSASDRYNSGAFDEALRGVLRAYDKIMGIMLPTLREERRKTYSPILPVSPKSGIVLQVPIEVVDAEAGLIRFEDEGERLSSASSGQRQVAVEGRLGDALGGAGRRLRDVRQGSDRQRDASGKITSVLGGRKPEGLIYELFLDENGEKISKSKGNGLTIEQWLTYGSEESLGFYLFRDPRAPRACTRHHRPRGGRILAVPRKDPAQPIEQQLGNPVWHLLRTNGEGRRGRQAARDLWPAAQSGGRAGRECHARSGLVLSGQLCRERRPKHIPRSMRW
jgi:lysyl-tRNA synthetase class 1